MQRQRNSWRFGQPRERDELEAYVSDPIDAYDQDAEELAARCESIAFEEAHSGALDLVPERPGLVLDVGAGSGRDAAGFAGHG
jgi:hypothetical protein